MLVECPRSRCQIHEWQPKGEEGEWTMVAVRRCRGPSRPSFGGGVLWSQRNFMIWLSNDNRSLSSYRIIGNMTWEMRFSSFPDSWYPCLYDASDSKSQSLSSILRCKECLGVSVFAAPLLFSWFKTLVGCVVELNEVQRALWSPHW